MMSHDAAGSADEPEAPTAVSQLDPPGLLLANTIAALGFPLEWCAFALIRTGFNQDAAVEFIRGVVLHFQAADVLEIEQLRRSKIRAEARDAEGAEGAFRADRCQL